MTEKLPEKTNIDVISYTSPVYEAKEGEPVVPLIYADEELRKILDGNEFDVTFDPGILAAGVEAAGITNHVRVILFSQSSIKKGKTGQLVNFEPSADFKRDTVALGIDESPEDIETAQIEANTRFWTAVLASNILDEPNSAREELESLRRKIKVSALKRKIGGGVLTTAGLTGKAAVMTGRLFLPAAVIAGSQVIGFATGYAGRRRGKPLEQLHLFTEEFDNHIIDKMIPLAVALAEDYPVIDYTVERPEVA